MMARPRPSNTTEQGSTSLTPLELGVRAPAAPAQIETAAAYTKPGSTIYQLACLAGVSTATVHPRTPRSRRLIIAVPDVSVTFFSPALQGIQDVAWLEGYTVLVGQTQHDPARENLFARMLMQNEADGLIIFGYDLPPEAVALAQAMTPRCAPIVSGEFSAESLVPSVHIDNAKAAGDALNHLYHLGHRQVGIVTGPATSPMNRAREAAAVAHARNILRGADCIVERGDFSIESGIQATARMLSRAQPPTAILCLNDHMAIGVMAETRRRNLRVPLDLSVVGFDDVRYARYMHPALTTIVHPWRAIGESATRLVLDALHHDTGPQPRSVTLPHTLTIRGSTGPPPAHRSRTRGTSERIG